MSWVMPEHLAKPSILRELDAFLNDEKYWEVNCANLLAKLHILRGGGRDPDGCMDLADVLAHFGLLKTERVVQEQYLEQLPITLLQRGAQCEYFAPPHTDVNASNDWLFNEVRLLKEAWFKQRDGDLKPDGRAIRDKIVEDALDGAPPQLKEALRNPLDSTVTAVLREVPELAKPSCAWWSDAVGPVEDILRDALIELIQARLRLRTPIDGYWLCAGADGSPFKEAAAPGFRCYVTWSPYQITFLILTPEEPNDRPQQPLGRLAHAVTVGRVDTDMHHDEQMLTNLEDEKQAALFGGEAREGGVIVIRAAGPPPAGSQIPEGKIISRVYERGEKKKDGG